MDYAYEPTIDEKTRQNSEKEVAGNNHNTIVQDAKTEETFNKLEQKLDQSFTKTTNFLYNLWNEDQHLSLFTEEEDKNGSPGSKTPSKDSSEDIVTRGERAAQHVLDAFDTKLQVVEDFMHNKDQQQKAAENATKLIKDKWSTWSTGLTQFSESLKTKLNDVSGVLAFPESEEHASETSQRLQVLGTDENIYLNYKGDVNKNDKFSNDDISPEVARDINLKVLADSLVAGNKIDYKTFWSIYFTEKQKILNNHSLSTLSQGSVPTMETNLPSWDDEDEEEDENADHNNIETNAVSDSSNEPFDSNDIRLESRESVVIVNKGNDTVVEKSITPGQSEFKNGEEEEEEDEEEADDDDDWQ